jgi:hypothetical protein
MGDRYFDIVGSTRADHRVGQRFRPVTQPLGNVVSPEFSAVAARTLSPRLKAGLARALALCGMADTVVVVKVKPGRADSGAFLWS